ncbi:ethanolamine ammonia-lyase subunit EutC [Haloferacaceae archaeon DSL9]
MATDPVDTDADSTADSDAGEQHRNEADAVSRLADRHPSRLGVGHAGPRPRTNTLLSFRLDHGTARDAVWTHVDEDLVSDLGLVPIQTLVADKDEYLARPDRGREISEETAEILRERCTTSPQVQIVVADGLSSTAVEANVPDLLPMLVDGLDARGLEVGTPVFVKYGRVDVMDAVGEELDAECCVVLIGERPGLATADSLSAYTVYDPARGTPTAKKSVISNIHGGGLPPVEAGAAIADLVEEMCEKRKSGLDLRSDDREFTSSA